MHSHTCLSRICTNTHSGVYNIYMLAYICTHMCSQILVYLHTLVCIQMHTHTCTCMHTCSYLEAEGWTLGCTQTHPYLQLYTKAEFRQPVPEEAQGPSNSHSICSSLITDPWSLGLKATLVPHCCNPHHLTCTSSRSPGLPQYSCVFRGVWPHCSPGSSVYSAHPA